LVQFSTPYTDRKPSKLTNFVVLEPQTSANNLRYCEQANRQHFHVWNSHVHSVPYADHMAISDSTLQWLYHSCY